jgi:sugar phosphate isomerase/epimerase
MHCELSVMMLVSAGCLFSVAAVGDDSHPFFAYKNSMEKKVETMAEQAAILAEIGFDGYDHRELDALDETLKALDAKGLKMFTIYFKVDIDAPDAPFNAGLPEALPLLKDRGTILWCNTHSKHFKPSDPAGDEIAVPIFQKLADMCAPYGVRIAPYPHVNMWVESPEDTSRLAAKVNRPNFGTSFNLYHWKVLEGDRKRPIEEVAKLLAPNLMVISINGDEGSKIAIGPLEEADIAEYRTVLKAFRDHGYRGPVGLQCYNIEADPRVHLKQSMTVWQQLKEQL